MDAKEDLAHEIVAIPWFDAEPTERCRHVGDVRVEEATKTLGAPWGRMICGLRRLHNDRLVVAAVGH